MANMKLSEEQVKQIILRVDDSTELRFKNEDAKKEWDNFVARNSDCYYNKSVVDYARMWAKYMQHLMDTRSKSIPEIAEETSYTCDINGITAFQQGLAVKILSEIWLFGDELRHWHNGKYGQQGANGIVNPAVWTISD